MTSGAAPLLTNLNPNDIPPDVRKNSLILPPKAVLDNSEFIYPLSPTTKAQFDLLWREIRQQPVII
ncbi:MAG: hypothetical protein HC778_02515 [Chamaesiphon sp. CSU_1_12]|nr:hypothetical protein [Chamaesiphon sp. CSU_1_12]